MQILNPLYDVVFKYLMEDNKVAKLLLSALIGQEITELVFLPQEFLADFDFETAKKRQEENPSIQFSSGLTVYRIDFTAKIRTETGEEKLIIIEVQKSKLTSDMLRFRAYLGSQYAKKEYFQWVTSRNTGRQYKAGIPIYAIFFLGYGLEEYEGIPVVEVDTCVKDKRNGEILEEKGYFIPSLFHKGIIVNIPYLKERYQSDLEKVLSIFDQHHRDEDFHILNVKEEDFPEKYRPIIRRLQAAAQEKTLRNKMIAEDDYLTEMNEYEERINKLQKEKEQERLKAENLAYEKEQERVKSIKVMLELGIDLRTICEKLDIDEQFLKKHNLTN
ncbi:hypothetical protein [Raineya orbicola]|uniref:PD-(D/E)XK nuclease family transposase n=1 Tax=Raineya orbicola TaxID=2016530 RepID=A0A2N3IKB4_9BACT|nr:hypothetical protein [Raineya orbicola]PKQ70688.1 PD-(D/E)XK nuclease family transposase [Raineya orbicola]